MAYCSSPGSDHSPPLVPVRREVVWRELVWREVVWLALALAALATGCEPIDPGPPGDDGTTTTTEIECTGADLKLEDGRCQPPGLPLDMPCPPGETPKEDGSCQAAGVPPSLCGEGFLPDGAGGCKAILPAMPCPDGSMAVPGDTECHEVSPCGDGTWGDIPIEANTQFVDGSYAGGDSDGSQEKPWKTIQAGLDAAEEDAVVAIAAGAYPEDLAVSSRPVRLWGVCPSAVTIQGVNPEWDALAVLVSGAEVHGVGITGPRAGIYAASHVALLIEEVWIRDTQHEGLLADRLSQVTVRGSLVERATTTGLQTYGGTLVVEGTAIRDVLPGPGAWGMSVDGFMKEGTRANLTVRSSFFERIFFGGANAELADLTVERVAMRDIAANIPGTLIPRGGVLATSANVTVRQSTFEGLPQGLFLSRSEALVEHVTVSGGTPIPPQYPVWLAGIAVQGDPAINEPGHLLLRESVVAHQPESGVAVIDASADIVSTLLRDNAHDEEHDAAVRAQDHATVTVRHSALLENHHSGLNLQGSTGVLESSVIRGVLPTADGGNGIAIRGFVGTKPTPAFLTVRSSLIEDCVEAAIGAIETDVVIETSILRDVKARPSDGLFGDALVVMSTTPERGPAVLSGLRVEKVARAGISTFGGKVDLGFTRSSCATFPLAGEALEGVPFSFNKTGDNVCGCPEAEDPCVVESPGLTPPDVH